MRSLVVAAIAVMMGLSSQVIADENGSADSVIKGAADALAVALKDDRETLESDRQALYGVIDQILSPRFDEKYAAQLVLGKHWRSASDVQKSAFIDAFYQAMLRRYADGVLQFDEERLKVLSYKGGDEKRKRTTVKTLVYLDDGSEVPVNYGLVLRKAGWKVYDVTIEGISYVRNFRTELNAEVSAKGLDSVIQRLQGEAVANGDVTL